MRLLERSITMMRRSAVLGRLLASQRRQNVRTFQTSSVLAADALDMVDTFARRHSESIVVALLVVELFFPFVLDRPLCLRHDCVEAQS